MCISDVKRCMEAQQVCFSPFSHMRRAESRQAGNCLTPHAAQSGRTAAGQHDEPGMGVLTTTAVTQGPPSRMSLMCGRRRCCSGKNKAVWAEDPHQPSSRCWHAPD